MPNKFDVYFWSLIINPKTFSNGIHPIEVNFKGWSRLQQDKIKFELSFENQNNSLARFVYKNQDVTRIELNKKIGKAQTDIMVDNVQLKINREVSRSQFLTLQVKPLEGEFVRRSTDVIDIVSKKTDDE